MTVVGGMSLVRQELTEIRVFFALIQAILQHSSSRTKNSKLKMGEKETGEKGAEPTDKVETRR